MPNTIITCSTCPEDMCMGAAHCTYKKQSQPAVGTLALMQQLHDAVKSGQPVDKLIAELDKRGIDHKIDTPQRRIII